MKKPVMFTEHIVKRPQDLIKEHVARTGANINAWSEQTNKDWQAILDGKYDLTIEDCRNLAKWLDTTGQYWVEAVEAYWENMLFEQIVTEYRDTH